MNILNFLTDLASEATSSFTILKASKDKKFLLAEDGTILNATNIAKSHKAGLISIEDSLITLVKGRTFTNAEGITFFTDKEATAPSFN